MRNHAYLAALLSVCLTGPAFAVDPVCDHNSFEFLRRTVVNVKVFDPTDTFERDGKTYERGVAGTAFFINPTTLATVEHVTLGAKLSGDWKDVILTWSDERDQEATHTAATQARIDEFFIGSPAPDAIVTIELKNAVEGARSVRLRESPLKRNEPVFGLGYPGGTLRYVEGHLKLPEPNTEGTPTVGPPPNPYTPFELYDPDKIIHGGVPIGDRYAFTEGASGSPIFDCDGYAAAVVNGFAWSTVNFGLGAPLQVTTQWGQANVFGLLISPLWGRKRK